MRIGLRVFMTVAVAAMGMVGLTAAQKPVDKFSAMLVNLEAPTGAATKQVQIIINRWSTDSERDQLANALTEQGQAKLLNVLGDLKPVGTIRPLQEVGYNLRYARQTKVGTSDRVVLVAERPMGHMEIREGGKSTEYPFTIIELRIGPDGKGEGKMSYATKVLVDKATNFVGLENYNSSPVLLNNVTREK